ncbi:MAG: hypothetical protein RTU30_16655 [Candidatus Thorarchaeota archaeon]
MNNYKMDGIALGVNRIELTSNCGEVFSLEFNILRGWNNISALNWRE